MCDEQSGRPLPVSDLGRIEQALDRVSRGLETLFQAGAASTEERDAFEACIEDLWLKLVRIRRALMREGADEQAVSDELGCMARTVLMLDCDLSLARTRRCS